MVPTVYHFVSGEYFLRRTIFWREVILNTANSPDKKMRIISGKYPGFAAMWRKLVLMYEKGPWRQKSGKYPDIFRSKALNVHP